jgi:ABC-2 type transport system ATP-binding protein
MPTIVEAVGLTKRYPGASAPAVDAISFTVNEGEIFGLLGPNGAGKTTLISILSCLAAPDGGSAQVGGCDVVRDQNAVKRMIGLVPQELALYPSLSAHQNLLCFGGLYGLRGAELRANISRVLAMVGLADRANDRVETLSGGMKRRINIAAGLLHSPRVLFLDEPTVGVDPQSRNFIFEGIEALRRAGMTMLYTTHYMEEAQRLCDRVAIIDQGRVIALDTPKTLMNAHGGVVSLAVEGGDADAAARTLAEVEGITGASAADGRILVQSQNPAAILGRVVEVATGAGVQIRAVEILEHNLESVFLDLTGRRLRD